MKISDTTIYINRGNRLLFTFKIENGEDYYIFQENDKVGFSIYEKKGLNQEPLVSKEFEPTEGTTEVDIDISDTEMKIGDMLNKEKEYWYEITLNKETVLGYDEDGAKKLILYPEGKDYDNTEE